jgi:hypothetical protein
LGRVVAGRQQGRQLALDGVQLADQRRRPFGTLAARLLRLDELPPGVRPAADVPDAAAGVQPLVPRQSVRLQVASRDAAAAGRSPSAERASCPASRSIGTWPDWAKRRMRSAQISRMAARLRTGLLSGWDTARLHRAGRNPEDTHHVKDAIRRSCSAPGDW